MKPARGRPRLSPEGVKARIRDYCRRFSVKANAEGFPPFPSGKRETAQHREWMALYRMRRRHATAPAREVRSILATQQGVCRVCGQPLAPPDAILHERPGGDLPGALHSNCHRLARSAEAVGPEGLDQLRSYLWPGATPKRRT